MIPRRVLLASAAAAALPWCRAAALEVEGSFTQGGLVVGRAAPGSAVTLDGEPVRVAPDGRYLLGFGRDAPARSVLRIVAPDGGTEEIQLQVTQRTYDVQRVDGLPPKTVTPDPADEQRIAEEARMIGRARARYTPEALLDSGWIWPAEGPVSGVYGSQRILNGEPRRPHFGVDIAAPAGTPAHAPADGIVSLAEPDLFFTGGTVMLDHGLGLSSIFAHLQEVKARTGDRLKQGDVFGTIGATGRATGPHLHWGMNLGEARLDPQLLLPPMPDQPAAQ